MHLLTLDDFKVFDISGFNERMAAILTRIRPKLTSIGEELAPKVSLLVDCPLYVHVAKHARRTVNPPDDTWAAFGASPRGYKKDVHFKVAVSRHCVRREFKDLAGGLKGSKDLASFKDEHDEDPAARLAALAPADLKKLVDELVRRRDGQFVLGRRIDAVEFAGLKPKQVEKIALDTFRPLSPLFQIHEARMLA